MSAILKKSEMATLKPTPKILKKKSGWYLHQKEKYKTRGAWLFKNFQILSQPNMKESANSVQYFRLGGYVFVPKRGSVKMSLAFGWMKKCIKNASKLEIVPTSYCFVS